MLGSGPRHTHERRFQSDARAVSGILAGVLVVAVGIALVAFSAAMFTGMAERPGGQPSAATDVELGPGGVTVELEAVGDADSVRVERNGDLVREIVNPQAGIEAVIDASNVSVGDTITVVGESDGNSVVLDSVTVDDTTAADGGENGGRSGSGASGAGSGGTADYSDLAGGDNMPYDGDNGDDGGAGESADGGDDSETGGDESDSETDDADGTSVSAAWTAPDHGTVQSLGVTASGPMVAGTTDGSLVVVNRSDGTDRATVAVDAGAVTDVANTTGRTYVGTANGTLASVDGTTVNWSVDVTAEAGADANASVAHVEGHGEAAYTSLDTGNESVPSRLVRTAADGTVEWARDGAGQVTGLSTEPDGDVYVSQQGGSTAEHAVRRVDENGTETWRQQLAREPTAVRAVGDGVIVALAANESQNTTVRRLTADGSAAWRHDTGSTGTVTALATGDGRTYAGLSDGTVVAIDDGGSELWTHSVTDNETGETAVRSLEVGPSGDVYVAGQELTRLTVDD